METNASPSPSAGPGSPEAMGRLSRATLWPAQLEAEYRAATLRDDGRTAAIVVGVFVLLTFPFVLNDLLFASPAGRLGSLLLARAVYFLSGTLVVWLGFRARSALALDLAILANAFVGGAFTILLQSTRPVDYYLPVMLHAIGVMVFFTAIPCRFSLQVASAAALTGSGLVWMVLFRVPPPAPAVVLIAFTLVAANLAGAFASWNLHRSRRLQFLAIRDEAETSRKLRQGEELFRTAFENASIGKALTDLSGRFLRVNEAFCRMLGRRQDELLRATVGEVTHPDDLEKSRTYMKALLDGSPSGPLSKRYVRADGGIVWAEVASSLLRDPDGHPLHYITGALDVTESRALREQFAVASRLAAVGTLVAGVAHEVNNPLGGAIASHGFSADEVARVRDLLRSGDPLDREAAARRLDEVLDALDDAASGEHRVATIVKDLTLLGRPGARTDRVVLDQVVEGAMRWIPSSLLQRAAIQVEEGGAPDVAASAGHIEQVVANLLTNAIRAAPDGQRARVQVRLGEGAPGFSRLEVADDGVGMTPEVMARMFDPFFTTRAVGQGMGLGLAICHAIVTSHGGRISATSVPGKGSTFQVDLPRAS
jgi:PAS domain S-box-containing protein